MRRSTTLHQLRDENSLTSVEQTRYANCHLVHGARLCTTCKQRLMQQLPVMDGWASAVSAKSVEA